MSREVNDTDSALAELTLALGIGDANDVTSSAALVDPHATGVVSGIKKRLSKKKTTSSIGSSGMKSFEEADKEELENLRGLKEMGYKLGDNEKKQLRLLEEKYSSSAMTPLHEEMRASAQFHSRATVMAAGKLTREIEDQKRALKERLARDQAQLDSLIQKEEQLRQRKAEKERAVQIARAVEAASPPDMTDDDDIPILQLPQEGPPVNVGKMEDSPMLSVDDPSADLLNIPEEALRIMQREMILKKPKTHVSFWESRNVDELEIDTVWVPVEDLNQLTWLPGITKEKIDALPPWFMKRVKGNVVQLDDGRQIKARDQYYVALSPDAYPDAIYQSSMPLKSMDRVDMSDEYGIPVSDRKRVGGVPRLVPRNLALQYIRAKNTYYACLSAILAIIPGFDGYKKAGKGQVMNDSTIKITNVKKEVRYFVVVRNDVTGLPELRQSRFLRGRVSSQKADAPLYGLTQVTMDNVNKLLEGYHKFYMSPLNVTGVSSALAPHVQASRNLQLDELIYTSRATANNELQQEREEEERRLIEEREADLLKRLASEGIREGDMIREKVSIYQGLGAFQEYPDFYRVASFRGRLTTGNGGLYVRKYASRGFTMAPATRPDESTLSPNVEYLMVTFAGDIKKVRDDETSFKTDYSPGN